MKKIIALLLAVFMLLSLCACGNGQETGSSTDNHTNSKVENSKPEEVQKMGLRIDLRAVTNTVKVKSSTGESEDLIDHLDSYEYAEHPLTKYFYSRPGAFSYNAWNCIYEMKEQPLDTEYTFNYETKFASRGGTMFLINENFYYGLAIPSTLKIDLKGNITLPGGSGMSVAKLRSDDITDIEYLFEFDTGIGSKDISLKKISDTEYVISSTEPIKELVIDPENGLNYVAEEEKTSYTITLDDNKMITVV